MFCSRCGFQNSQGEIFCKQCEASLGNNNQQMTNYSQQNVNVNSQNYNNGTYRLTLTRPKTFVGSLIKLSLFN